jgi:hypothetical protein
MDEQRQRGEWNMEFAQSRIAMNRQQAGTNSQVSPLAPSAEQKAIARELTPAQQRAVAFAQQQIMRAREAQKAQAVRKAELLRLQQDEDKDFEATLTAGAANRRGAHPEQASTISFRRVLGEVLRSLRTKDKKTLREVSERAGVSLGYLSEVERGQKEASSELLGSIASALGMRLSDTLRLVADEIEKLEDAQSRLQPAA